MLGDKVGAIRGKVIGQRVLESDDVPRVEVTAEMPGELGGVQITWLATYTVDFRPDGTLYGDGHGLVMTADGVGTWKAAGAGTMTTGGAASFRGAAYLTSAPAKLEHLMKVALLFEYEADGESAAAEFWCWQ